ncbi:oxidoreductase [Pseudomonas oryzihabitans]|uniref:oxidoreductase n=1 Tax=Pseudomonas oryzihabitans TaxID=47885 RepID=UPI0016833DC4|nr:oxidoreductase [Pseudomonas oryzihabitans]
MNTLIGSSAFVTGASQGVGEAVAHALVDAGVEQIVLAARNLSALERVRVDLERKGAKVLVQPLDLKELRSIEQAVAESEAVFGQIDILVNSGGVTDRGGLLDTSPETFDHIFDTNLRGNFFMMQHVGRLMKKTGGGVIINISSMMAHGGLPHLLPYSASKAALNLITRNASQALRFDRIRLHAINLGWTLTPAEHVTQTTQHGMPEDWAKHEGDKQPFGRLLLPKDPAQLCVFLASTGAEMMTGTVIDLEQWVSGVVQG